MESIRRILSQEFQPYHVCGDGNRLFLSIAHQMEQDESKHAHYRSSHLLRATSEEFINCLRSEEGGTRDQYTEDGKES